VTDAVSHPLAAELDTVLARAEPVLRELRGARLFITGGTGFFGTWLLESLTWAVERLGLDTRAVVLTRSPEDFARKAPRLVAHPALRFHAGDARRFESPDGAFTHVLHLATTASSPANQADPLDTFDVVVDGTRRALELAQKSGARHFLLTSSGAVYGRQPLNVERVAEDAPAYVDPTDPKSTYAEAKRAAEQLCQLFSSRHGLSCPIARGFAFSGAHLPLEGGFAVGNFVRDALAGQVLRINGDGTPLRSYLDAVDLTVWLWTLLVRGQGCRAYNVGSEQAVSIAELAEAVADVAAEHGSKPTIHIARQPEPGRLPERYIPSTARARQELGLEQTVSLRESLRRMLSWNRALQRVR
jgi:nucleoside-diphosphate-sugar epimerase